MALADYDDLKAAIGTFRSRSSSTLITNNDEDLVTLAEAEMNRTLILREMWTNTPLTGSVGSRELSLPSDFAEPEWLRKVETAGESPKLKPETSGSLRYYVGNGEPSAWCINGDAIDLDRPCSSAYSFLFRYRQRFALSDASPTNWLLTNHPDVYLAGVLLWSGLLILADDIVVWQNKWDRAVSQLTTLDGRSVGIATASVDDGLLVPGGYDPDLDTVS